MSKNTLKEELDMELLKDQVIIVMIKKLGGKLEITANELDDTCGMCMTMIPTEDDSIIFELVKDIRIDPDSTTH